MPFGSSVIRLTMPLPLPQSSFAFSILKDGPLRPSYTGCSVSRPTTISLALADHNCLMPGGGFLIIHLVETQ